MFFCGGGKKKNNTPTFHLQGSGYFSSSKYHIILLLDNPSPQPIMLNMGVIYRPDFGSGSTTAAPQQMDVTLVDLATERQPSPQNRRRREREKAREKKVKNY